MVTSRSTDILEALSLDMFNGSVTPPPPPVAEITGLPPTLVIVIFVPAVRLGVRSHVRVSVVMFASTSMLEELS